ncbi:MAG: M20/M25/M40 family metallo-hydrolase, partial [Planctomycetota bacterium]
KVLLQKPLLLAILLPLVTSFQEPDAAVLRALESISQEEITETVEYLASPAFEGRDSPSVGLSLTARFIAEKYGEYGLVPAKDASKVQKKFKKSYAPYLPEMEEGDAKRSSSKKDIYLRPWKRPMVAPVPRGCSLSAKGVSAKFEYGEDFVPVMFSEGTASGALVFVGFGRESDIDGAALKGKIALFYEGEPRRGSGRTSDASADASLWKKLTALKKAGASGALAIRRPPPKTGGEEEAPKVPLAYRFSLAEFNAQSGRREDPPRKMLPVLIVSEAAAVELSGLDLLEIVSSMDGGVNPDARELEVRVAMKVKTELQDCLHDNVVGYVKGTDSKLAKKYIVVGAHYDHIGGGPRGRIGYGADDNASGTSALLQLARAVAENPLKRSVYFVAFSAEEDGLLGSKAFCRNMPIADKDLVFMLNLDMIGRGPTDEVVVLGLAQNPKMEKVLDRALALSPTGIKEYQDCRDGGLFTRSDHYSFHQEIGCATLFFFENYPVARNSDYHTWRDLPALVNMEKIRNTARLAFNTLWIVGNDSKSPARAKR